MFTDLFSIQHNTIRMKIIYSLTKYSIPFWTHTRHQRKFKTPGFLPCHNPLARDGYPALFTLIIHRWRFFFCCLKKWRERPTPSLPPETAKPFGNFSSLTVRVEIPTFTISPFITGFRLLQGGRKFSTSLRLYYFVPLILSVFGHLNIKH